MNAQPKTETINVASGFTRYPSGRYVGDGKHSGQAFRERHLMPALQQADVVAVELDGVLGYGSSFLEEAFGGLRREPMYKDQDLRHRFRLISKDRSLISEINDYLAGLHI